MIIDVWVKTIWEEVSLVFVIGLAVGLLLGIATFPWRAWWDSRPWK